MEIKRRKEEEKRKKKVFFYNDTATTEIYTLSLHDALPIYVKRFKKLPDMPYLRSFSTRLLRNNYCKIFSELSINVERRESVKTTVQWIEWTNSVRWMPSKILDDLTFLRSPNYTWMLIDWRQLKSSTTAGTEIRTSCVKTQIFTTTTPTFIFICNNK